MTCFSQRAPNLSLFAQGACIDAAGIPKDTSECYGGTSQAAPHVTGAAAVLAGAAPFAPVDQIERALSGSGPVIRDRRSGTKHRLDVVAALDSMGLTGPLDIQKPETTKPAVTPRGWRPPEAA